MTTIEEPEEKPNDCKLAESKKPKKKGCIPDNVKCLPIPGDTSRILSQPKPKPQNDDNNNKREPQSILDTDEREQKDISNGEFRICQLRMRWNNRHYVGTGNIIYVDATKKIGKVLTNAHNVVQEENRRWKLADQISITIHRNNKDKIDLPGLSWTYLINYQKDRNGYDLGFITFSTQDSFRRKEVELINSTKFVASPKADALLGIWGFPAEKEGLWGMDVIYKPHDGNIKFYNKYITYNNIDTTPGQSGSPVYTGNHSTICGVHRAGSQLYNIATRIRPLIINVINQYISQEL